MNPSAACVFLLVLASFTMAEEGTVANDRASLEKECDALIQTAKGTLSLSSDSRRVISETPALQKLARMNPEAVPYMLENVGECPVLAWVAQDILKVFPQATDDLLDSSTMTKWLSAKTRTGYEDARAAFPRLRNEWARTKERSQTMALWQDVTVLDTEWMCLRTKRELTALGEVYVEIQNLGVFVLPLLMEGLKHGEYDFLPMIGHLTNRQAPAGAGKPEESAELCLKWWAKNSARWKVPEIRESR